MYFVLCFLWSTAGAQPGVVEIATQARIDISRDLQHFEDPSTAMTFDEVSAPTFASNFKPFAQKGNSYNFGLTASALWFRVTLRANAAAAPLWYWAVPMPMLDTLDLYVSQADGGYTHQRVGDAWAMSDRSIPHKDLVMPVRLQPGGDTTVYLRVLSGGGVALPVTLWEPAAFKANEHREYALLGAYFGLAFGLFVYNLLLYFSIRDRAYLSYVVFVAFMALSQAHFTGFAAEFIWGDNARWNTPGVRFSMPLTVLVFIFLCAVFSRPGSTCEGWTTSCWCWPPSGCCSFH